MDGHHGDFWGWVGRDRSLFFYLLLIVLGVVGVWVLPRTASGEGRTWEPSAAVAGPTTTPATLPAVATSMPAATAPATQRAEPRNAIESLPIRAGAGAESGKKSEAADGKGNTGTSGAYAVMQVMGALGVVIGLVFLGRAAARKFVPGAGVGAGKGVMEVLARYPLSRREALVMVRVGSQIVVLCQGKDRTESVLVISEPNEVANVLGQVQGAKASSIQAGFGKLLANARIDLEQGDGEEPTSERMPRLAADRREALTESEPSDEEREPSSQELESELDEMAAARRQLMELRERVKTVREGIK